MTVGSYRVLAPCVVGDLHYAQVPAGPIEVDDTLAAALVSAGVLAAVNPDGAADRSVDTSKSRRKG